MRGTFVAIGTIPTSSQSRLNISLRPDAEAGAGLVVSTGRSPARPSCRARRPSIIAVDPRGHRRARSSGRSPRRRRGRRSRAAPAAPSGDRRRAACTRRSRRARARLVQERDRVEQVREEQAVDDEARRIRDLHGRFPVRRRARGRARASPRRPRRGRRARSGPSSATGLNTCRPTKRCGRPVARARSRTERADVVVARIVPLVAEPPQPPEQLGLRGRLLGDRLHDEGGVAEAVEIGGYGYVARAQAAALLDEALDLGVRGVRPAGPEDHLTVLGRDACEPGGDGPAPGDPDPLC